MKAKTASPETAVLTAERKLHNTWVYMKRHWQLYLLFLLPAVALTLVYALVVALYGQVYPGELAVGLGGFVLQGCAFVAMDLMISGFAGTPVSAAVLAFGGNFALWIVDMVAGSVSTSFVAQTLDFFSLYARNEPFLMGQLSFASIGYDLSFILGCLAITVHALDSRRYRGA